MPTTKTKKKPNAREIDKLDAEARRAQQSLRRYERQQRSIASLSRRLKAATRRADGARLNAARELCEDTGYAVIGIAEVDADQRTIKQLQDRIDEAERRVRELEADRSPASAAV